jgi:hypothetical protein
MSKVKTLVIAKIILLCGVPDNSTMVRYIYQLDWKELEDVTTTGVDEVKDFFTVRDDGKIEAKLSQVHLRKFNAFLLYNMRKGQDYHATLMKDNVLEMSQAEFKHYCGSTEYFTDVTNGSIPIKTQANTRVHAYTGGNAVATNSLTDQEFRRGVMRNKANYADLKDDNYFSTWNCVFVATAHMHHTNNVLDKLYNHT